MAYLKAYLKAVDQNRPIGSNASTATGGSSNPPSSDSLAHTPLSSSTTWTRTGLSSQAKPFVSSGLPTMPHIGWMPIVVNVQDGSSQQRCSQTRSYNEKAQEDVYRSSKKEPACKVSQLPNWYSEKLQEEIYRAEETAVRGRLSTREERMVIYPRTPSPPYASPFIPDVATAVASWRLDAAEIPVEKVDEANNRSQDLQAEVNPIRETHSQTNAQHPVKHTFIHFDVDQPKRLVKSASSPSILLHNAFHNHPMSAMSELHKLGQCRPCLYFHHKVDGCRQGSDCRFCHMCTPDEIKEHNKNKKKQVRARKRALTLRNAGMVGYESEEW